MAKTTAKPMTKTELISAIAEKNELTKQQVAGVLASLTEIAYQEAKQGFTIPGIGKLVIMERKARVGRNPATGAEIQIPAKTVLKFRIAKAAQDAIVPAKG